MTIRLGENQYGKAEVRLVRVERDTERHRIRDLSVSSSLRGDFEAAHVGGDQSGVLPTDSQKNTVFSFAEEHGVGPVEEFGRLLAEHFVQTVPGVSGARVAVEEYGWDRIGSDGAGHDHAFVARGDVTRTTAIDVEDTGDGQVTHVVSGVKDLTLLKSTGSEFRGFHQDRYTTLPETDDRILATSLQARWRYTGAYVDGDEADRGVGWDDLHQSITALLLDRFAEVHSFALQHTLYAMGEAVLEQHPQVAGIRFSAPNKHHFLVDLSPFGMENPGEVFHAADRPYGLIEASVVRDDADDPGNAW